MPVVLQTLGILRFKYSKLPKKDQRHQVVDEIANAAQIAKDEWKGEDEWKGKDEWKVKDEWKGEDVTDKMKQKNKRGNCFLT